ncbi:MAG: hypothetical protein V1824_04015 [archaeon]
MFFLKRWYYSAEDKYYEFVEKSGLYKITDKIDKVIPSFLLFIIIILLIIGGLVFLLVPKGAAVGDYKMYFSVIDKETGMPLPAVPLQIATEQGGIFSLVTNSEGKTEFVPTQKDGLITVDIDYSFAGYNKFSSDYSATEKEETTTIELVPASTGGKITYSFSVLDDITSSPITSDGIASFSCNNTATPPEQVNVVNGEVSVQANSDCQLLASIIMQGYEPISNTPITASTFSVHIRSTGSLEPDTTTYSLTVYTNTSSGMPVSDITVSAYLSDIYMTSCVTDTSGTCQLSGLEGGSYELKTTDNRSIPIYENKTLSYYLTNDGTQNITLNQGISGYIKIKVVDAKTTSRLLKDVPVSLKVADEEISFGNTDNNGEKIFTVSDLSLSYRVVVDANGYMITSSSVTAFSSLPSNPQIIKVPQVTSGAKNNLIVKVVGENAKGYPGARVVLYNSDTGFLTDYSPKDTNLGGYAVFYVASGNYYAVAIKGSSRGQSSDFVFDVRSSAVTEPIIIPMDISNGTLVVKVVDKENEPVSNVRVAVYDVFGTFNINNPLKYDLTDATGQISLDLDGEQDVFAVVGDIDPKNGTYGVTQSRLIRIKPGETSELEVKIYKKRSASNNLELKLDGLYREGNEIKGNLSPGNTYQARFTLFVPTRDEDEYTAVGALVRSGNLPYMNQESMIIKSVNAVNAEIYKYTQYSDVDGYGDPIIDDEDTLTQDDSKWAKIIFEESYYNKEDQFATAYEFSVDLEVKDTALFSDKLDLYYLGYGFLDSDYEEFITSKADDLSKADEVSYASYYVENYSIGDEINCSDEFCFTGYILDLNDIANDNDDIKYSLSDDTTSLSSQKNYKLHLELVNNNPDRQYSQSRILIKNLDKGIDFKSIFMRLPLGNYKNETGFPSDKREFDLSIGNVMANDKITIDTSFVPILAGDRHLNLSFVSDDSIVYTKDIVLNVSSDKTFDVIVTPEVVPAAKSFSLKVEVKDMSDNTEVIGAKVMIKNKYKTDEFVTPFVTDQSGTAIVTNIPEKKENEKFYVYVTKSEYETFIKEITTTKNVFNFDPEKLGVSLNVANKTTETVSFKIRNLSERNLVVKSMELRGEDLEIIDTERTNNSLAAYAGYDINAYSSEDDAENYDTTQNFAVRFDTNPRFETIKTVQNLNAKIKVVLQDSENAENSWELELPVSITVGNDGMIDSPNCLTLSEYSWEDVVINKAVEKQFMFNNSCVMKERSVPLANGIKAKVEFDSDPLGRFTLNFGNRLVELSSGYFRTIFDSVDSEAKYPVVLRYEPQGRYSGDVTGRIIFKSVNETEDGSQDLISEYKFNLHVVSLEDCMVISKNILELKENSENSKLGILEDSFTIENKGCGKTTSYTVTCDDCPGIYIAPKENIDVEAVGSSEEIKVTSNGATPGQYMLHVRSKIKGARGTEKNVAKIKVIVRPVGQCLDLDRYEYDIYRAVYSENTGRKLSARNFDTGNIINSCYKQTVKVEGSVKPKDKLWLSLGAGLRDGIVGGVVSGLIQDSKGFLNSVPFVKDFVNTSAETYAQLTAKCEGKACDKLEAYKTAYAAYLALGKNKKATKEEKKAVEQELKTAREALEKEIDAQGKNAVTPPVVPLTAEQLKQQEEKDFEANKALTLTLLEAIKNKCSEPAITSKKDAVCTEDNYTKFKNSIETAKTTEELNKINEELQKIQEHLNSLAPSNSDVDALAEVEQLRLTVLTLCKNTLKSCIDKQSNACDELLKKYTNIVDQIKQADKEKLLVFKTEIEIVKSNLNNLQPPKASLNETSTDVKSILESKIIKNGLVRDKRVYMLNIDSDCKTFAIANSLKLFKYLSGSDARCVYSSKTDTSTRYRIKETVTNITGGGTISTYSVVTVVEGSLPSGWTAGPIVNLN